MPKSVGFIDPYCQACINPPLGKVDKNSLNLSTESYNLWHGPETNFG